MACRLNNQLVSVQLDGDVVRAVLLRGKLLSSHSSRHLELFAEPPRVGRSILVLRLVHGLHDDDVVLRLEGEVFGSKTRKLKLDLELVVAGRHLNVMGSLIESGPATPIDLALNSASWFFRPSFMLPCRSAKKGSLKNASLLDNSNCLSCTIFLPIFYFPLLTGRYTQSR